MPPEGVGYAEYLEGKYGPGALDAVGGHLRDAAAADGLPLLDLHELERRPNTFLAHRLLAGALEEGEDEDGEPVQQTLQQRLGLGLLSAHWARGEDVGEREVLERLAEAAGMPAERVVAALDDDLTATAVRLDEAPGGQARHPRRAHVPVRPPVRGERRADARRARRRRPPRHVRRLTRRVRLRRASPPPATLARNARARLWLARARTYHWAVRGAA